MQSGKEMLQHSEKMRHCHDKEVWGDKIQELLLAEGRKCHHEEGDFIVACPVLEEGEREHVIVVTHTHFLTRCTACTHTHTHALRE